MVSIFNKLTSDLIKSQSEVFLSTCTLLLHLPDPPFRFSKGLVPRPVQQVWFQNQCSRSGSKTSAAGLVPRPVQWVWFQDQCSRSGSKTSAAGLVPRPVQQVWFQDQCSGSGSKTSAAGLVPRLVQRVWFQDQCSWYKITNAAVDKGFLLRFPKAL